MKGIVLAGGAGSRLHPLTAVAGKQLQPVYDKPMVYYPLATLMQAGITDIAVVTTPADQSRFRDLLGDGETWGLSLTYLIQPAPDGIAQAFVIARDWLDGAAVTLILGDNIFHGLTGLDAELARFDAGALIRGYPVNDPQRYGVVEIDDAGEVASLEEKSPAPRSNLAVVGLYTYDAEAPDRAAALRPSERGELEITDLNLSYLDDGLLRVTALDRGVAWLDSGTHDSLLDAANYIATVEKRQGLKIACLEEIALGLGLRTPAQTARSVATMPESPYRSYCERLLA